MRVEDLERELRADRPEIEPDFSRQLDEWAAAGFPRDRGLGPRSRKAASDPLERLRGTFARLRTVPPRRVLLPAGALATVAVIGAVAVGHFNDDVEPSSGLSAGGADGDSATTQLDEGGSEDSSAAAPAQSTQELDGAPAGGGNPPAVANEYELGPLPQSRSAMSEDLATKEASGNGVARGTDERIIDATARLTLGAEASEVQDVANDVVEVADSHDGIVIDSQVTTDQGGARAAFEIEVPYTELDATIEDLSGLADVISRTEAGEDITARAVRAERERANLLEQVSEARAELLEADTRAERLAIKARIRSLQAQADSYREEANTVKRQGRMATLDVEITSEDGDTSSDWSIEDALDDAGRVLEVIAGIALVTLAVLLPVTLVGAIVWWLASRAQRGRRERALDA